jgi:hypothetical protein
MRKEKKQKNGNRNGNGKEMKTEDKEWEVSCPSPREKRGEMDPTRALLKSGVGKWDRC